MSALRSRNKCRANIRLVFLWMMLLSSTGCAARLPRIGPPEAPPPVLTRENISALLFKNYGGLNSIRASGTIEFRELGEDAWRGASIVLLAQRPDQVRVRAYRLLAPTLFEFISDGRDCWLFLPSERTVYFDDSCGIIENRADHLVISAETIVAALLVISDYDAVAVSPSFLSQENGIARLSLSTDGVADREIWMDPASGLVTKQLFLAPNGSIEAEIDYLEHTALDASAAPVEVEVFLPQAKAAMRLHLDQVKLAPEFPSTAFLFSPPGNARIINLDDMR
jgi:outer membrane lipoprotein-sorting protein